MTNNSSYTECFDINDSIFNDLKEEKILNLVFIIVFAMINHCLLGNF